MSSDKEPLYESNSSNEKLRQSGDNHHEVLCAASSQDPDSGRVSAKTCATPECHEMQSSTPSYEAGSEGIRGCSSSDVPRSSQELPPSYEASAADTRILQGYYDRPLEIARCDVDDLPRQFVIVQIQVAGPSRRRDSAAPQSFEIRPDMDSPPLFTISREASRRQEKKKSPSNSTGISVSLFRADASSDIVSEWTSSESSDHITCGCPRCKEITIQTSGRVPSDFSLQVSTPSGRVVGYVQLNHDTMDVTGPEKWTPLFTIDARPGTQKRRQIKRGGKGPSAVHPVGSVQTRNDAIMVQLPAVSTPDHDILLLSGIFATLFVPKVWRDVSELPKEDGQCCSDTTCEHCLGWTGVICAHFCCQLTMMLCLGLLCGTHNSGGTVTI